MTAVRSARRHAFEEKKAARQGQARNRFAALFRAAARGP